MQTVIPFPQEPQRSSADWAAEITAAWRSSVAGIIRTGDLLIRAKTQLAVGKFEEMIESDLPFGPRTGRRLMEIARHPVLTDRTHASVLPPSWMTLHALTKLPREELQAWLRDGRVHPELQRQEITGAIKAARREAREVALGEKTRAIVAALNAGQLYNVILADPPWRFQPYSRKSGLDRSADNHYPTMTVEALKALKVPAAPDCQLFMWATAPMLPQALDVIAAWDFEYKTHAVWVKMNRDGAGTHRGTGYWFANSHELLLVATRGAVLPPPTGLIVRSVLPLPVGKHSEKPGAYKAIIGGWYPHLAKLEMFARPRSEEWTIDDSWDQWGNET